MNTWTLNRAIIVGRDHEFSKKNRQDFIHAFQDKDLTVAVVCDGCGESKFSEVGASLTGLFFTNYLRNDIPAFFASHQGPCYPAPQMAGFLKNSLETRFTQFLQYLQYGLMFPDNPAERISFIDEFMLCTILFVVIYKDIVITGRCGDGVLIINGKSHSIDQAGRPGYLAYKVIPKHALKTTPSALDFFLIETYPASDINSIAIGSDGIQPIIDANLLNEIYGTRKRQLQRKFNLWQNNKLFGDDASCIVIEKQESTDADENSNLQKEEDHPQ